MWLTPIVHQHREIVKPAFCKIAHRAFLYHCRGPRPNRCQLGTFFSVHCDCIQFDRMSHRLIRIRIPTETSPAWENSPISSIECIKAPQIIESDWRSSYSLELFSSLHIEVT